MNKKCIVILSIIIGSVLFGIAKVNAGESNTYVRPWFGLGYTLHSNSVAQTYDASVSGDITRNNLHGGFGVQILTDLRPKLKAGVEASFQHYINETTSNNNHPLSPTGDEYCYHTVNTLAMIEMEIGERLFVQAGSGLATAVKPNNKYTGTTPYFMLASGINFKLSNRTSIPVIARVSTLDTGGGDFGNGNGFGSILPLMILSGVTMTF